MQLGLEASGIRGEESLPTVFIKTLRENGWNSSCVFVQPTHYPSFDRKLEINL